MILEYLWLIMNTLYTILFPHLQEYAIGFLDLFSFLSVLSAILVILNKNPIVSVLFLIGLFVLISGYLMLIGMNFIGISYLLVYIGAVSILFLFILMLINIRISEIQTESINSLPLAILISISFYITLYGILPYNSINSDNYEYNLINFLDSIKTSAFDNVNTLICHTWDSNLLEVLHITSIGNILYTNYFLWLILASIILLLAMVGTIIITIKQ